jgi:excisionase family DNA binding protein
MTTKTITEPGARLLSIEAAAAYTGLGVPTIRRRLASGEIRARKFGRAVRIERADLDEWIDAQPVREATTAQ